MEDQKQHRHVYVIYIGIGNATNEEEIEKVIMKAYEATKNVITTQMGEVIYLPTRDVSSRIECINPQYITRDDLLKKHDILMSELHEHLDPINKELIEKNTINEQ
jgi:hypothetical protein